MGKWNCWVRLQTSQEQRLCLFFFFLLLLCVQNKVHNRHQRLLIQGVKIKKKTSKQTKLPFRNFPLLPQHPSTSTACSLPELCHPPPHYHIPQPFPLPLSIQPGREVQVVYAQGEQASESQNSSHGYQENQLVSSWKGLLWATSRISKLPTLE